MQAGRADGSIFSSGRSRTQMTGESLVSLWGRFFSIFYQCFLFLISAPSRKLTCLPKRNVEGKVTWLWANAALHVRISDLQIWQCANSWEQTSFSSLPSQNKIRRQNKKIQQKLVQWRWCCVSSKSLLFLMAPSHVGFTHSEVALSSSPPLGWLTWLVDLYCLLSRVIRTWRCKLSERVAASPHQPLASPTQTNVRWRRGQCLHYSGVCFSFHTSPTLGALDLQQLPKAVWHNHTFQDMFQARNALLHWHVDYSNGGWKCEGLVVYMCGYTTFKHHLIERLTSWWFIRAWRSSIGDKDEPTRTKKLSGSRVM